MSAMELEITLYGAFRQFGDRMTLEVSSPCSVTDIKNRLAEKLGEQHWDLVNDSVLASDTQILPAAFVMQEPGVLSILPPVCGG